MTTNSGTRCPRRAFATEHDAGIVRLSLEQGRSISGAQAIDTTRDVEMAGETSLYERRFVARRDRSQRRL